MFVGPLPALPPGKITRNTTANGQNGSFNPTETIPANRVNLSFVAEKAYAADVLTPDKGGGIAG